MAGTQGFQMPSMADFQSGPFNPSGNNQQTGASRQIGEFGGYPVGQVDVRTPFMQMLEQAAMPLLFQTLLNPQGLAQQFGSAAGPVPTPGASGLASFLFGGSTGQATPQQGQQQPGSRPGQNDASMDPYAADYWNFATGKPRTGAEVHQGNQSQGANNLGYSSTQVANLGGPAVLQQLLSSGTPLPSWVNPNPTTASQGAPPLPLAKYGSIPIASDPSTWGANQHWWANIPGLQSFATGGLFDPNKPAIVGELGPELITPAGGDGLNVTPLGGAGGAPSNAFNMSPVQGQGTGAIQQLLMQNPEGQAFEAGKSILQGPGGLLGGGNSQTQQMLSQNPEGQAFDIGKSILQGPGGIFGSGGGGQGVMQALQPLFQQNLKFGLNALTNSVPSVQNSGAAIEGADVTSRALNDYNLLAAQALQQGQQNTLGGLGILGQLAGQAGNGQFGRSMQADQLTAQNTLGGLGLLGQLAGQAGNGQFGRSLQAGQLATQRDLGYGNLGLQAQQQQWNQTVNPTLQLLLAAMGMATPTAYQTVVPGKK